MDVLLAALRRSDPRLLAMTLLLLFGVGLAVYKMATAFTVKQTSPEYERRQGSDFSVAPRDTLIEGRYLETKRLPDNVYADLAAKTLAIAAKAAQGDLAVSDLVRYGMDDRTARTSLRAISQSRELYAGRRPSPSRVAELDDASQTTATLSVPLEYPATAAGDPPASGAVVASYQYKAGRWQLVQAVYDVG